jgi:hypothetical protein
VKNLLKVGTENEILLLEAVTFGITFGSCASDTEISIFVFIGNWIGV